MKRRKSNPILLLILAILASLLISPHIAWPVDVNVLPNLQHGLDTTGDVLSDITGDDAAAADYDITSSSSGDLVYTVEDGCVMHLDTFDVTAIPDSSTITAAVLHLQYGPQGGYNGTLPVRYDNGAGLTTTGITPSDIGDWSADLTFNLYAEGVDTKTKIQNLDIEFTSNDSPPGDALNFDYVWVTVSYTGADTDSAVEVHGGGAQANFNLNPLNDTSGEKFSVLKFQVSDKATSDEFATLIDQITVNITGTGGNASTDIAWAELWDDTGNAQVATSASITDSAITFGSAPDSNGVAALDTVASGQTIRYTVNVYMKNSQL
ncbi:MAG: hypothetical protein JSV30_02910, partial [Candidatus Omnitrophota bacterium]